MTVAELIAELSKIEDQTLPVATDDVDYGWNGVDRVEVMNSAERHIGGTLYPTPPKFVGIH